MTAVMLERRRFLQVSLAVASHGVLTGCGMLAPVSSTPRARRVGYFAETSGGLSGAGSLDGVSAPGFLAFRNAMRDLGYEADTTLELDLRVADINKESTYTEKATELVASRPDVFVASGTAPAVALAQAAATLSNGSIPLVFIGVGAPVEIGIVESLARPGRNVTGFASFSPEMANKRLELLKEAVPSVVRPAVLWNPADVDDAAELAAMQPAASRLGLTLRAVEVRAASEVAQSVEAAVRDGADAVILAYKFAPGISATTALRARVPAVSHRPAVATSYGALLAYGASTTDMHRRAAAHVDKILQGVKIADLPVEQPTSFDLVVNLKTAETLGLVIPQSILAQATEISQ